MGSYIPVDLDDAVRVILSGLDEESLRSVKKLDSASARAMGHHTIGQWVRNNWGLNSKEGPLYDWFVEHLGLHQPDDMSGILLHCIWADLSQNEREIEAEVQKMKDHWKKMGLQPDGTKIFENVFELLKAGARTET